MSQENVEIVRAALEAWNARHGEPDFAHFHPELVYHPRADEPDPSPHVGRDAYERLILGFTTAGLPVAPPRLGARRPPG